MDLVEQAKHLSLEQVAEMLCTMSAQERDPARDSYALAVALANQRLHHETPVGLLWIIGTRRGIEDMTCVRNGEEAMPHDYVLQRLGLSELTLYEPELLANFFKELRKPPEINLIEDLASGIDSDTGAFIGANLYVNRVDIKGRYTRIPERNGRHIAAGFASTGEGIVRTIALSQSHGDVNVWEKGKLVEGLFYDSNRDHNEFSGRKLGGYSLPPGVQEGTKEALAYLTDISA